MMAVWVFGLQLWLATLGSLPARLFLPLNQAEDVGYFLYLYLTEADNC